VFETPDRLPLLGGPKSAREDDLEHPESFILVEGASEEKDGEVNIHIDAY
jgi:hypothetical protein